MALAGSLVGTACGGGEVSSGTSATSEVVASSSSPAPPAPSSTEPNIDEPGAEATTGPTSTTAAPPITTASWPENSTVQWFDHVWEFGALTETFGESETVRTVSVEVGVRNPLTDRGYSLPASWVALRSPDGEVFATTWASNLRDETSDLYLELGAEQRGEWRLDFEVPNKVSLADLVIELGSGPDRRGRVRVTGVDAPANREAVALATSSWSGEYSWNSAELVLTGAFASTSAGQYDNGQARPAPSFNDDRQADEDEVFVHLDFEITEISSSGVGGINVNTFRIRADDEPFTCASDAPGLLGAETAAFSTTCPVPVDASVLLLEIGTDPCVGGCDEWLWTSTIDASFLEIFR